MAIDIVHCSDLHLDKPFSFSSHKNEVKRKKDLNKRFEEIIDYAIDKDPDLFLIGGDIYDKVNPTNSSRIFFISQIRRLRDAGIAVYMIGGNHDVPKMRESNTPLETLKSAGIGNVFTNTDSLEKESLEVDGKEISIYGKSYKTSRENENPLKNEKIDKDDNTKILLLHASFHGLNVESVIPGFEKQRPIYKNDVEGWDYVALGHYHNHFQRQTGNGTTIANPGSIDRLSFQEENDDKGFYHVTLEDGEVTTEFVKLDARDLETKQLELSEEMENPTEKIINFLETNEDPEKILRLRLKGSISMGQQKNLNLSKIYQNGDELFFSFKLNREELEVKGYGRIYTENIDTSEEAFEKRMNKLIEESEENEEFLREVKEKGSEYLEGNK